MTANQVAAAVGIVSVLYVIALLTIEFYQIGKGKVVITTVIRNLVKKLPWPFILLALVFGFMAGHCFGN